MNRYKSAVERLKARARTLKSELTALYYAYRSPETGLLPRLIILLALAYALSPVDLIPDFIPVLGYLDDIVILPGLIALSIRLIPREIMNQAREKAEKEPLSLKKKWYFALPAAALWIIILMLLLRTFLSR